MEASLRSRLVNLLGVDGVADGDAITPAGAEQIVGVCGLCAETGTALTVISSHTAAELGAVRGIVMSLSRMTKVSIDGGAQIARAEAGVTITALGSEARRHGLAPVGTGGGGRGGEHVGSAISRGTLAARSLVGIDLVLPTGVRVTAGGRTLKDVTGYDLSGFMLGSMGRLAIIVAASFRLVPAGASLPEARAAGPSFMSPLFVALQHSLDPAGRLSPAT